MKRLLLPATVFATALGFAACVQNPPPNRPRPGGFHQNAPEPPQRPMRDRDQPSDEPEDQPAPPRDIQEPTPPPSVTVPAPQVKNYEYGKPVPGKPGFVTSPYAPSQGYVDVRGFAPATEVKDPYTGKIFLVP